MFENTSDWVISSEAPVEWGTFNDHYVVLSGAKREASLWDGDMVWSLRKLKDARNGAGCD